MPLEKENLTWIAVKHSKEKSPLESLEKLIINLFNTRTYRSPVPAKERHLQAEGWGSVLTTIQSCRMTSLPIVRVVIVVCNVTAADSLCQAFPGGNKHPGFLVHQGRTDSERQKLHHPVYYTSRPSLPASLPSSVLTELPVRAAELSAFHRTTNCPQCSGCPSHGWCQLLLQTPHNSRIRSGRTRREISLYIRELESGQSPEEHEHTAELGCHISKCGAAYSAPLVTGVLGRPPLSGQHADALKRLPRITPTLGSTRWDSFQPLPPTPLRWFCDNSQLSLRNTSHSTNPLTLKQTNPTKTTASFKGGMD